MGGNPQPSRRVGSLSDDRLTALADQPRRDILRHLRESNGPVRLKALARQLTAGDNGTPADEDTIQRVAITLVHHHLPKLDDVDVVEYDHENRLIETDEAFEQVTRLLSCEEALAGQ